MSWLRSLLVGAALFWFRKVKRDSVDFLKIEGVRAYIKGIASFREAFIIFFVGLGAMGLLAAGIVLFMTGVFILLPWTIETKAYIFLGLGLIAAGVPSAVILLFLSEKAWMKWFKIDSMMEDILEGRGQFVVRKSQVEKQDIDFSSEKAA